MGTDLFVPILMIATLGVVLVMLGSHLGWFLRKPENREHAKNAFKQD